MPDYAALLALLPPEFSGQLAFVPFVILGILGLASLIDAFTGRVPDLLIVLGLGGALGLSAFYEGWWLAGGRLLMAVMAFAVLRILNEMYFNLCRRDAFGMGDAKWTAVAAIVFGLVTVFWSWIIGAWLALFWMGGRRLLALVWPSLKSDGTVHFAPFLFAGLVAKLYVVKFLLTA